MITKKYILLINCLIVSTHFAIDYTIDRVREKPRKYIDKAIEFFKIQDGKLDTKIVVEIGTMAPLNHDVDNSECDWCTMGHSTILWARTGAQVYSIDIDKDSIENTKRACANFTNVNPVVADGIEFLNNFDKPIDLLFLDAWDIVPGIDYEQKHLEAYLAAKHCFRDHTMILVDDTDIEFGGKGKLVVPQAITDGFKLIFSGRQTLLIK